MVAIKDGVRRAVRATLPPIIWSAIRSVVTKFKGSGRGALGDLDALLSPYLNFRAGYFVELGANDGLRQSNTLRLEEKLGWHGLLIEPVVHRYFELVANRSPNNSFACAACVPFDFGQKWVEIEYGDLMTIPVGLHSDLPSVSEHRESAKKFL